jgi:hypothetical protein
MRAGWRHVSVHDYNVSSAQVPRLLPHVPPPELNRAPELPPEGVHAYKPPIHTYTAVYLQQLGLEDNAHTTVTHTNTPANVKQAGNGSEGRQHAHSANGNKDT